MAGVDCSSLQKLDVSGNKFSLVGVERLLEALDISRLCSVNLSATIGPGHAQHLLRQLAKLLLESVRITVFLAFTFVMCFTLLFAFCGKAFLVPCKCAFFKQSYAVVICRFL